MKTSINRIKGDIEAIAGFNKTPEPGEGYTRLSYSTEDIGAKKYLIEEMKSLGLRVNVDTIGNLSGTFGNKGNEGYPPIIVGSHLDTVIHGGKFDGVVGVVGGLEVIRTIRENNVKLKHPLKLMVFAEEEGSNFGATTSGSRALIGELNVENLKDMKKDSGESYYEVLKKAGVNPDNLEKDKLARGDIKAMLELHIEQSIVLDRNDITIGIVTGISGIRAYTVKLVGESNHAGSTPMNMRKDPMVAAGKIIGSIGGILKKVGSSSTVTTVGKIKCYPNVQNVIPGSVEFTLDIRDVDDAVMNTVLDEIKLKSKRIAEQQGVECHISCVGESKGRLLSKNVIDTIEKCVNKKGFSYMKMNSGAVHDAALMSEITDVGMIFVPSRNGKSHVPEEFTSYEDVKKGCDVLLETVIMLDKK